MENRCKKNYKLIMVKTFISFVFNHFMVIVITLNWLLNLLTKFNGLILLYCLTHKSISRVSGAYDHKMQKGKVLDLWKKLR